MSREIEIKGLEFSYDGKKNILKNIDLEVRKGEFLGIVGRSGSGKSTLLKFLNGILRSDCGDVEILGRKFDTKSKNLKELRKKVGIVFQFSDDQFFEDTIREDIYFAPKVFGMNEKEIEKNFQEVKEIFNLTDEMLSKNFMHLSGGEKRRAAIAGILIYSPEILVLDEPTIGLDSMSKKNLLESLDRLNRSGKTIIVVSHDLDTIWEHIGRVILLKEGQKKFDGDKRQFLDYSFELERDEIILPHYIQKIYEKFGKKIVSKNEILEFLKQITSESGDEN